MMQTLRPLTVLMTSIAAGPAWRGCGADGDRDPAGAHHARPGADPHRHAGVQRWRAHRGNRGEGPRRYGLHARTGRFQQQLPRRIGLRDSRGLAQRRCRGQHRPHLLRTDGRQVAVPHGQRRHRVLHGRGGPVERADGGGAAAEGARYHQRHVVQLDHRHRLPRPRPRRRRQVPARAAGLRRAASRGRLLHRQVEHDPRALRRSLVPGEQRSQADGRADQEVDEDLSVHARWYRDEHRHGAPGQGAPRPAIRPSPRPSSWRAAARQSTRFRRAITRSSR